MKRIILGILLAVCLAACTRSPTISVPVEFCEATPTGNVSSSTYMQCYPIGNNACGMQMPVTTESQEVIIKCEYKTWQ